MLFGASRVVIYGICSRRKSRGIVFEQGKSHKKFATPLDHCAENVKCKQAGAVLLARDRNIYDSGTPS